MIRPRSVMADVPSFEAFIIAHDMMLETGFPTVSPSDTLADVMKRLSRYRGEVPVVEDGRLVGTIWPEDVIERYNTELFKRDMASSMVSTVSRVARCAEHPGGRERQYGGDSGTDAFLSARRWAVSISANRYGATVLMIKLAAWPG